MLFRNVINLAVVAGLVAVAALTFVLNLLALVLPIYMLQVYDRVLTSRSEMTLLFITLIAVGLFMVYSAL